MKNEKEQITSFSWQLLQERKRIDMKYLKSLENEIFIEVFYYGFDQSWPWLRLMKKMTLKFIHSFALNAIALDINDEYDVDLKLFLNVHSLTYWKLI